MAAQSEVFAVVWFDGFLGLPLHLHRASAAEAIESAQSMRAKDAALPAPMLEGVRAVHIPAGSDVIVVLDGPPL